MHVFKILLKKLWEITVNLSKTRFIQYVPPKYIEYQCIFDSLVEYTYM